MVRFFSGLVGVGFVLALVCALWSSISGLISDPPQETVAEAFHKEAKPLSLASDGPFGKFDERQLQRGFQVFKEVCAACHGLDLVHFRDLEKIGYNKAEVKAIADQWVIEQPTINPDTGEATTRKNLPSDPFPSPFPNEVAARAANNNALPPELSDIVKAREGGAPYVHSILTGYQDPDPKIAEEFPDFEVLPGLHYNPYFASLAIAMPPPLTTDDQVQYVDGTKATIDQMATDVSAFLVWTAEPNLQARHRAGWPVLIFLAIFCLLAWGAYKNVWRDVEH